jgi:hypothetical protein
MSVHRKSLIELHRLIFGAELNNPLATNLDPLIFALNALLRFALKFRVSDWSF